MMKPSGILFLIAFLPSIIYAQGELRDKVIEREKSCPVEGNFVEFIPQKKNSQLIISLDEYMEGYATWQGDLNNDEVIDYIISWRGTCGNWGHCEHSIFVGCKKRGRYVLVWGPEYTIGLKVADSVTTIDNKQWRDVMNIQRTGNGLRGGFNSEVHTDYADCPIM